MPLSSESSNRVVPPGLGLVEGAGPDLVELFAETDRILYGLKPKIIEIRRFLHAHPEASGQEYKTTAYLVEQASAEGLDFRVAPSGRGLIVDHQLAAKGKRFAMRADIDALRLQDEKTASYRSQEENRMHACGHDAHTAMAAGATLALQRLARSVGMAIPFRTIFQPAEETARGALEMIEAGAVDGIEGVIALHVDPQIEVGTVGYRQGVLTAHCKEFEIILHGLGGHAARPHTTFDPIAAATMLVQSVYSHLPRTRDARDPGVISFGVIQGGINPNVIPETVQLRGTIRAFSKPEADAIFDQLRSVTEHISSLHQIGHSLECTYDLEAVRNDRMMTQVACRAATTVFGARNLIQIEKPSMGGEDFSRYLNHVPGCMLRLGTHTPHGPLRQLHSSSFDIDEGALYLGARWFAHTILHLAHGTGEI